MLDHHDAGGSHVGASAVALLLVMLGGSRVAESAASAATPRVGTLSNGMKLPLVGLGCSSGIKKQHVLTALEAGYRHLDTAQAYQWGYTEHDVGDAVHESAVPREEVFIQTKIFPEDLGYEPTKRAVDVSLQRLRTAYVDSMLIHKPRCWEGACSKQPEGTWQDSWKALEELYESGKVRAIGICDVDDGLLDELLRQKHKPHIIQNWMDPLHQDKHIRARCAKEGIQYQGYSTLGPQWVHFRGHKQNPVLTHPSIVAIAQTHDRAPAQVVINWAVKHGVAVIPASKDPARQVSNFDSFGFDLSGDEMAAIDALDGTVGSVVPDPNEVSVTFNNKGSKALQVAWMDAEGREVHIGDVAPGGGESINTFHGHRFRFLSNGQPVDEHVIHKNLGPTQSHDVGRIEL